jgi:hypothetical protein
MTKLSLDSKGVVRETTAQYKGRPVVVELRAGVVVYRLKGTRQSWVLDHEVGLAAAMKQEFQDKGGKI